MGGRGSARAQVRAPVVRKPERGVWPSPMIILPAPINQAGGTEASFVDFLGMPVSVDRDGKPFQTWTFTGDQVVGSAYL